MFIDCRVLRGSKYSVNRYLEQLRRNDILETIVDDRLGMISEIFKHGEN